MKKALLIVIGLIVLVGLAFGAFLLFLAWKLQGGRIP
jgi:HAMP domain-containing protein